MVQLQKRLALALWANSCSPHPSRTVYRIGQTRGKEKGEGGGGVSEEACRRRALTVDVVVGGDRS